LGSGVSLFVVSVMLCRVQTCVATYQKRFGCLMAPLLSIMSGLEIIKPNL
jgi:hypothetical protein